MIRIEPFFQLTNWENGPSITSLQSLVFRHNHPRRQLWPFVSTAMQKFGQHFGGIAPASESEIISTFSDGLLIFLYKRHLVAEQCRFRKGCGKRSRALFMASRPSAERHINSAFHVNTLFFEMFFRFSGRATGARLSLQMAFFTILDSHFGRAARVPWFHERRRLRQKANKKGPTKSSLDIGKHGKGAKPCRISQVFGKNYFAAD